MKANEYDALLQERRIDPGEIARRRDAERLAEIARNLETLGERAAAEAREREGGTPAPAPSKPFYRYALDVEIPATEVAVLVDALADESFSLRERIGKEELGRQLEAQRLVIDARSEERWPDFQRDIETLSTYLSEPISGREIHVEPGSGGPRLEGWVILGRRGEVARLALDLAWDGAAQALVDRGIDMNAARRRWQDLPEWVRSSLTHQGAGRVD